MSTPSGPYTNYKLTEAPILTIAGGLRARGNSSIVRKILRLNCKCSEDVPKSYREPITFSDEDLIGVKLLHEDPLITTLNISGVKIRSILVNTESFSNITFMDAFKQVRIDMQKLNTNAGKLDGFVGVKTYAVETITLYTSFGEILRKVNLSITCTIIIVPSPYNMILSNLP